MTWEPITLEEMQALIAAGVQAMGPAARRLWVLIRIPPAKWRQEPWGNDGGGFWAVAVCGSNVLWYNDIEDGFNVSRYSTFGTIDEYWCNQDELPHAVAGLRWRLDEGPAE